MATDDVNISQADRDVLFNKQLSLFANALPMSLIANIINSTMLLIFLWQGMNHQTLIIWYLFIFSISVYRYLSLHLYRANCSDRNSNKYYRHFFVGTALSGLCWGAAGYFLFVADNVFYQTLLAFIIAGMTAGSILTLSTFLEISVSYMALVLIPFFIRLVEEWTIESNQMALMVFLFSLVMVSSSRRSYKTIYDGLLMRHKYLKAEDQITKLAYYDDLTGLANRRLLTNRLEKSLNKSERHGYHSAILFLDLDRFKEINDTLGHSTGDGLLVEVANRLSLLTRREDTVARLGGDEFIIHIENINNDSGNDVQIISNIADKIRAEIAFPYKVYDNEITITASIGIITYSKEVISVDELLMFADRAMYTAKDQGRNRIHFYEKGD